MDLSLDDYTRIIEIDKSGMLSVLQSFPEDCISAVERANEASLGNLKSKNITRIVFAGMGGSSIGGKMILDWLLNESKRPMVLSQSYHLPAFVDNETLVFIVSYSGNTEETLSLFNEAHEVLAPIVVFTSGGTLGEEAKEKGLPIVLFPPGYRPRAAISHQFFSMATIMHRLGLVESLWGEIKETFSILKKIRKEVSMEVPTSQNLAKQVALRLFNKIPFVYGSKLLEGAAYRFGTQLNENGKVPSGSGSFPEVFHNAILGREWPSEKLKTISLLIIRDCMDDCRVKRKIEKFKELFAPRVGDIIELEARGIGRLARIFSLIYMGDYISTYLGILNGLDPSSNLSIDELKKF